LFVAVRGEGTSELELEGEGEHSVQVDDIEDVAAARFCESVEAAHSHQGEAARVAALLGITAAPLRMDSQAKYGVVARGEASIYLRLPRRAAYRERIWDHAAGSLLVREAGGEVTDAYGRPLDFTCGRTLERNEGIVATNGRLHRDVLAAVRRVLAD
jgi:3'(2'), 5'-bisphosphate nucleotidase